MQFFNFGSQESFLFFQWIVNSGQVDPDELVAKAFEFETLERNEWLEMGQDISTTAQEELT